jgi:manganese-dependent inorganic pyrophosphatase
MDHYKVMTPPLPKNLTLPVVLTDASDRQGLPDIFSLDQVIEIIDHRPVHSADTFPNAQVHIELVGSAATLVTEKFMESEATITESSAALLYCAIVSNTLNFRAAVTTDRDKHAAQWLLKKVAIPENFVHDMFVAKSDVSGLQLKTRLYGDCAVKEFNGTLVAVAQLEVMGAEELVTQRLTEIQEILHDLKTDRGAAILFLSIIDLETAQNIFVAENTKAEELASHALGLQFSKGIARRAGFLLRKEIAPLLKQALTTK